MIEFGLAFYSYEGGTENRDLFVVEDGKVVFQDSDMSHIESINLNNFAEKISPFVWEGPVPDFFTFKDSVCNKALALSS